jgi:hypothetical protein
VIPINAPTAYCVQRERGLIATNGKATDKFNFGTVYERSCTSGGSISGATKEVKLTAKGAYSISFSPKIVFGEPGPCVYALSKVTGTFKPGEAVASFPSGIGKLQKKASSPSCPVKEAMEADSEVFDENDFQLFTELRG